MGYRVAAKDAKGIPVGVLASPYGQWDEGALFSPPPTMPKTVLANWLEKGVVVVDSDGPLPNELEDEDILTNLNRKQLKDLIKLNGLKITQINSTWSDDVIRQAIRDLVGFDVSELKLPPEEQL